MHWAGVLGGRDNGRFRFQGQPALRACSGTRLPDFRAHGTNVSRAGRAGGRGRNSRRGATESHERWRLRGLVEILFRLSLELLCAPSTAEKVGLAGVTYHVPGSRRIDRHAANRVSCLSVDARVGACSRGAIHSETKLSSRVFETYIRFSTFAGRLLYCGVAYWQGDSAR